eukprot:18381_1
MSEDLERILAQFLKVNRYECCYKIYDKEEIQDRKTKYLNQHKTHVDWNLPCMVYYMCNRFHQLLSDEQINIRQMGLEIELEKKKEELWNELKNVQHGKQQIGLKTEEKTMTRDKTTITKELETVTMTLGNIKNCHTSKENEGWSRKQKIFPLIWNKFEEFRKEPNIRQRVKFD